MNVQVSGKVRNLIFLCLLAIIIVCIFIANNIGNKQNKGFAEESNQFQYALQLLSQNKATEAEPLLKALADKHPDNYEVIWKYGMLKSTTQNFKEAQALYQKAQDLNVYLIKDPLFLAEFGEVLYKSGDIKEAEVYLEESLKYNPNEQISTTVNALLANIKQKDQQ